MVLASRFFARHSGRPMASRSRKPGLAPHGSSRRMVVAVVPPVDELDLVGPLQVFNSVNRLAGKPIYVVEVVTSADSLTVDGESVPRGRRVCGRLPARRSRTPA